MKIDGIRNKIKRVYQFGMPSFVIQYKDAEFARIALNLVQLF